MRFRNTILAGALCWTLAAVAFGSPALAAAQTKLPDAPAKQKVEKICGGCHEIETVISSRRTLTGWQQITEDMVARGGSWKKRSARS